MNDPITDSIRTFHRQLVADLKGKLSPPLLQRVDHVGIKLLMRRSLAAVKLSHPLPADRLQVYLHANEEERAWYREAARRAYYRAVNTPQDPPLD